MRLRFRRKPDLRGGKPADDMIFGQAPEYIKADAVDMKMYENREELLDGYHKAVLNEIERMKKSHE
jgi:L-aspartate oxidase